MFLVTQGYSHALNRKKPVSAFSAKTGCIFFEVAVQCTLCTLLGQESPLMNKKGLSTMYIVPLLVPYNIRYFYLSLISIVCISFVSQKRSILLLVDPNSAH